MFRIMALAATLSMLPVAANAAVTYEVKDGKLSAIRGIESGKNLRADEALTEDQGVQYRIYIDVEFIDGNCATVFNGCTSIDKASAMARRMKDFIQPYLLDNVMVDGKTYNFDSNPASIAGCSDATTCNIYVGYAFTQPTKVTLAGVANAATGANTFVSAINALTIDTAGMADTTFARLTAYRVVSAPAVPEPATWAMMLVGFGAIGAAMRRRRQGVAVRLV